MTKTNHIIEPLEALSNISDAINSLQKIDVLLEKIMDIALKALDAERGFILLTNDDNEFSVRIARNISDDVAMDLTRISNSVVHQALANNEPVISYDVQADERFTGDQPALCKRQAAGAGPAAAAKTGALARVPQRR